MARRVSWTNNSSGHSGTYVYRDETLDPQALPAPVATVDPVAQGATAEWVDNEELSAGDYDYAVQDFDGQGEGALSGVVTHTVPLTLDNAQIGDEIEGGVYAGTITYADAREFHIIGANYADEGSDLAWGNEDTVTGATDEYDGAANQALILASFDDGSPAAFYHCRDLASGGHTDWYMPSRFELKLLFDNLASIDHPEFITNSETIRLSSTEVNFEYVYARRFSEDTEYNNAGKTALPYRVRPIRRVAV